MPNRRRVSKMFGALVLGGGLIAQAQALPNPPSNTPKQPPATTPDNMKTVAPDAPTKRAPGTASKTNPVPSKIPDVRPPPGPKTYCQLEFTLNQYDRDDVKKVKTCLDGKSHAEILKVIEDAKKNTCASPFCGCWLG